MLLPYSLWFAARGRHWQEKQKGGSGTLRGQQQKGKGPLGPHAERDLVCAPLMPSAGPLPPRGPGNPEGSAAQPSPLPCIMAFAPQPPLHPAPGTQGDACAGSAGLVGTGRGKAGRVEEAALSPAPCHQWAGGHGQALGLIGKWILEG